MLFWYLDPSGGGSTSKKVHLSVWASDRYVPGNYDLVTVFVEQQSASNKEWSTRDDHDAAFQAYKNTPVK